MSMIKELAPVNTQISEKRQIWREKTLNCFLAVPAFLGGETACTVETGIKRGLAPDSEEGRRNLALCMGDILSFVMPDNSDHEGEKFLEDLDKNEIAKAIGIDFQRLEEILNLMVDYQFIKSKLIIEKRKREKNF